MGRAGNRHADDLAYALSQLAGFEPRGAQATIEPHFAARAREIAALRSFTVFRVGEIVRPIHRPEIRDLYMIADERRPEGRPSRMGSLICSPTLAGATQWLETSVLYNGLWAVEDVPVWMLHCRADSPWVYSASDWSAAKHAHDELLAGRGSLTERDRLIDRYWKRGQLLEEWCGEGRVSLPEDDAEVLVGLWQIGEVIPLENPLA